MSKLDKFKDIELAIQDIRDGKMVIVVDDEDREDEGDFIIPADFARPEDINFMMKHARGLICVAITEDRAKELNLGPMVSSNTSLHETNFTVSVDARDNISTGISGSKIVFKTATIFSPNSFGFNIFSLIILFCFEG